MTNNQIGMDFRELNKTFWFDNTHYWGIIEEAKKIKTLEDLEKLNEKHKDCCHSSIS